MSECSIKVSLIALLGVGGRDLSSLHAKETAEVVNKVAPEFLSFLTVTVVPKTALDHLIKQNQFAILSHHELLIEMKQIIKSIELKDKKIIFRANHVSNNFPLSGVFPKDQSHMLAIISKWIDECPKNTYPCTDYRHL